MTRGWALLRSVVAGAAVGWAAVAAAAPVTDARFQQRVTEARAAIADNPATASAQVRAVEALTGADTDAGTRLATADWLWAELDMRKGDTEAAAPRIASAVARVRREHVPTQLAGDILLTKGLYDSAKGDVAATLDDYQRAHTVFERVGDARGQARALLFIAFLYGDANDHAATLRYALQAHDVYRGDPAIALAVANTLAQAYKDLRRYPEAEAQLREALAVSRAMHSPGAEAHMLRNLARVQLLAGDVAAADRSIRDAFRVSSDGGGEAPFLWATAAQAALQHGQVAQAETMIRRSFAGSDLATTPVEFRENHQTAYDIYRRTGDDVDAVAHLAALKRLDDQAVTLATSTNTALMGARFDFANQELKIAKLKADELTRNVAYERAQARTERMIFVGVAGTTLIIIALLGYGIVTIRRSRNEVSAANDGLATSNVALGKALAAKTEFLATTSHEIRTPLNGILGMTQVMLADAKLDAGLRDRIGIVHGAGITMRALVDDILDVAKMETGNLTLEAVPLDLRATLSDVSRMWEEQARAKGLSFALDLTDCPARIVGDPARMRQVVFNLLANALKFTASGGIVMRAGVAAGTPARFTVAVTDSGIGIPPAKLEEIFESFRQGDAGTTRQFGGTGLGLAICRNLARAMGGDVTVASVPGAGSTFTLTLPMVIAEDAMAEAAGGVCDTFLVVDRNPIARGMFRAVLAPHCARVDFATDVEGALAAIAGGGVVRVLVDDTTLRAEPDQYVAMARIVATGVETVLLWPSADATGRHSMMASGVTQIIAKPLGKAALVDALFPKLSVHDDRVLVSDAA